MCTVEKNYEDLYTVMHGLENPSDRWSPELLEEIERLPRLAELSPAKQLDLIARIAYLESHQTQILRGGGSLPEMIVEGLLLHIGGYASYYNRCNPAFNIWGNSIVSDFEEFKIDLIESLGTASATASTDEKKDRKNKRFFLST